MQAKGRLNMPKDITIGNYPCRCRIHVDKYHKQNAKLIQKGHRKAIATTLLNFTQPVKMASLRRTQ
jgi:hypothetical protein